MQFSIQCKSRWTLQLINGISNDLQKLLKYYNGTTIFVSFTELFPSVAYFDLSKRAALCLNGWELLTEGSSHLNCHKLSDLSE